MNIRLRIMLRGAVQGVGFRPFVYRLAKEMRLTGWVNNSPRGVTVEVEGERTILDEFAARLRTERPPRAFIQGVETAFLDRVGYTDFEIRQSDSDGEKSAVVLPDIATCPDCAAEILDPGNRRYLYPFTNCTNCGPRFSIIRSLPYDRANTTMAKFEMCVDCAAEYHDPENRRFHAQPNACPRCGPQLALWNQDGKVLAVRHEALIGAAEAVREGKIVALKGIGGFQLLVDAGNADAIRRLRARKHREEKPFALMYPSLMTAKQDCEVDDLEENLLVSPESPIVLLARNPRTMESLNSVAPGNPWLGIMLPYSPLHLILMRELGIPVVATSGNISDEPICIDEREALRNLGNIADLFLVHDRPIERQVDDSIVRVMAGRTQLIRRARGFAPFPIQIREPQADGQTLLAVGGQLKNTVAINSGRNVFLSQHIGDLSTAEAYHAFGKVTSDFQGLFDAMPSVVVHDLHPDYLSTQFALRSSAKNVGVQHHLAHVAACMAENEIDGKTLGVSWDGTGYGEDGTIWGSEFMLTDGGSYDRLATFRAFRLPGGSASVKEPRRTAIGVLYEIFGESIGDSAGLPPFREMSPTAVDIMIKMLRNGTNSPLTTSAGRLFDAVSSLLGIRQVVNFEGQAAMELEFAIGGTKTDDRYDFELVDAHNNDAGERRYFDPLLVVNWEPIVRGILADLSCDRDVSRISVKFHNTLVEIIAAVALKIGEEKVALTGGCFQNKYLTERSVARLEKAGFKVYRHQRVPSNDGGISLGQIAVALRRGIGSEGARTGYKSENRE